MLTEQRTTSTRRNHSPRRRPRRRVDVGDLAAGLTVLMSGGFVGVIFAAWLHIG